MSSGWGAARWTWSPSPWTASDAPAADRLLARAAQVAGDDGLRCLVSYRAIAGLAVFSHERQAYGKKTLGDEECAEIFAILDSL